jgi:hypothetical protein
MKRFVAAALVAAFLACALAGPAAAAPDDYDETQSNPLRVAAYVLSPVGFTLEWLIFRPFHYVVSRPYLEPVFGHHRHAEIRVY